MIMKIRQINVKKGWNFNTYNAECINIKLGITFVQEGNTNMHNAFHSILNKPSKAKSFQPPFLWLV